MKANREQETGMTTIATAKTQTGYNESIMLTASEP